MLLKTFDYIDPNLRKRLIVCTHSMNKFKLYVEKANCTLLVVICKARGLWIAGLLGVGELGKVLDPSSTG